MKRKRLKHWVAVLVWVTLIDVAGFGFQHQNPKNLGASKSKIVVCTLAGVALLAHPVFHLPLNLALGGKRGSSNSSQIDNEFRVFSPTPISKSSPPSNFKLNWNSSTLHFFADLDFLLIPHLQLNYPNFNFQSLSLDLAIWLPLTFVFAVFKINNE